MIKKLTIPLLLLAVTAVSMGQGFGGGRQGGMMGMMGGGESPTMMLLRDDVRRDLGLTDDQLGKLQGVQESIRDRMMAVFQGGGFDPQDMRTPEGREKMQKMMKPVMDAIEKETMDVLTAEQRGRLTEIFIQVQGNRAVNYAPIAEKLMITDEQKSKIAALRQKSGEAMRGLFERMRNGEMSREEMSKAWKKNEEIMNAEIGKILTEAQRTQLTAMRGTKPFVADMN